MNLKSDASQLKPGNTLSASKSNLRSAQTKARGGFNNNFSKKNFTQIFNYFLNFLEKILLFQHKEVCTRRKTNQK